MAEKVSSVLASVPGTRTAFAERTNSESFVDIVWRREELARYGISVDQAQKVVDSAVAETT